MVLYCKGIDVKDTVLSSGGFDLSSRVVADGTAVLYSKLFGEVEVEVEAEVEFEFEFEAFEISWLVI